MRPKKMQEIPFAPAEEAAVCHTWLYSRHAFPLLWDEIRENSIHAGEADTAARIPQLCNTSSDLDVQPIVVHELSYLSTCADPDAVSCTATHVELGSDHILRPRPLQCTAMIGHSSASSTGSGSSTCRKCLPCTCPCTRSFSKPHVNTVSSCKSAQMSVSCCTVCSAA